MEKQNIEIGSFYKFGELGVVYEVIGIDNSKARIRVVESGEELDYPIEKISTDIVVH